MSHRVGIHATIRRVISHVHPDRMGAVSPKYGSCSGAATTCSAVPSLGRSRMATTDSIADGHEDGQQDRWVTYDQLAEIRRTSRASAIRQARRRKWRRQQDNQGNVLVLVPVTELRPSPDSPPDEPKDGHE